MLLGFQRKNVIMEDIGNNSSDEEGLGVVTKDIVGKLDFENPSA